MPRHEQLVLCGGVRRHRQAGQSIVELDLHGRAPNVKLNVEDLSRRLIANLPDECIDLLEVASYVYAADGAISRGGKVDAKMGARWRRNFRFVIPVRRPELWASDQVSSTLVETLSFLSEDEYDIEFTKFDNSPPASNYFPFPKEEDAGFHPDEVILYRLNTWNILGRHLQSLTLALVEDSAPKLDHPAADDHVGHSHRRPFLFLNFRPELFANSGIVFGRPWFCPRQADHGMHKIGTRDNTDDLIPTNYGHALNMPALH